MSKALKYLLFTFYIVYQKKIEKKVFILFLH